MGDRKLSVAEMILFGVLAAMTFALKLVMAPLPNIEPVSLLIMVYAAVFGLKALYPTYIYVVMEILYYGLGTWNFCYLYVWGILAVAAWALREMENPVSWALLSGAFGLSFGALCAPVDAVVGGAAYAAAKWVSGIPFDIAHCAGNFCIALILFRPLRQLLQRLYSKIRR